MTTRRELAAPALPNSTEPEPSALRARIVELARGWLGTPYLSMGRVKGAGVDCAMMPLEVYIETGLLPQTQIAFYPEQWALHHDEEIYLQRLLEISQGTQVHEVMPPPERVPLPGDFLLFRLARTFAHGAIVIDWPLCIHAHRRRGITLVDAQRHKMLAQKIEGGDVMCFSFGDTDVRL